jgi:hypothetical protein
MVTEREIGMDEVRDCELCRPVLQGFESQVDETLCLALVEVRDEDGAKSKPESKEIEKLVFYTLHLSGEIPCQSCKAILQLALSATVHIRPLLNMTKLSFKRGRGGARNQIICADLGPTFNNFSLYISRQNMSRSPLAYLYPLNPRKIDIDFAKNCLEQCSQNHSHDLAGATAVQDEANIYLIDLKENCLIAVTTSSARYVALSYVWGAPADNDPFMSWECAEHMLHAMLQKGFFCDDPSRFPAISWIACFL